jgi:hypothetical protein
MKTIIIEEELLRIKEIMGVKNIVTEASEVMPQNNQYKTLVDELIKKVPEIKNVCSVKDFNQSTIDNMFMKHLTKLFGDKTIEFMDKFKSKMGTMDKTELTQTISTLRGYLAKPKEGFEFIKQMVGMETKEPVSEQIVIIAVTGFMVVYALISFILLLFGKGGIGEFVGCRGSF